MVRVCVRPPGGGGGAQARVPGIHKVPNAQGGILPALHHCVPRVVAGCGLAIPKSPSVGVIAAVAYMAMYESSSIARPA